jgi:hypothetical protein
VPTAVVDVSSPFGKEGSRELSIQSTSLGGVADIYKIVTVVHAEFIGVTSGRTAHIHGGCSHPWTLLRPAVYTAGRPCTVDSSPLQLAVDGAAHVDAGRSRSECRIEKIAKLGRT